ncbi:MAG: EamA family transporter [Clostridia bacterium]
MWVVFAFLSALFAGATAILAKIGIRNTDSDVATAIRTVIILLFSWLMVLIVGAQKTIVDVSAYTLLFLILSGFATGASWLCYFKALQLGDVNQVTPIDKSSTVLTMLLAFLLLGEQITWIKFIGMLLIAVGTYLMIVKKQNGQKETDRRWIVFAMLSAVFAAMTSILGKIGIAGIDSNLGTAIRTIVVLIMAWGMVLVTKKQSYVKKIDRRSLLFICLSGVTTGLSWLCYYRALQDGQASIVVPIDKLSIVVTVLFSYVVLKEKLNKKGFLGLALIVIGTLSLLIP